MENGIFESALRTSGDLAAIFECDEDGGYFYLLDLTKEQGQQARAVIAVSEQGLELPVTDVSVRWNASQEIVGLCIGGDLWAAFDQHGSRYGGDYGPQKSADIPLEVISRFMPVSDYGLSGERDIRSERH